MAWNVDREREEDVVLEQREHANWLGAAVAIFVLIVATVTLTLVAGGFDIVSTLLL